MSTLAESKKAFITGTLVEFQTGQLTLEQAATRLLTETRLAEVRKAQSNRRLKSLCGALQRESNGRKRDALKRALRSEFYFAPIFAENR